MRDTVFPFKQFEKRDVRVNDKFNSNRRGLWHVDSQNFRFSHIFPTDIRQYHVV